MLYIYRNTFFFLRNYNKKKNDNNNNNNDHNNIYIAYIKKLHLMEIKKYFIDFFLFIETKENKRNNRSEIYHRYQVNFYTKGCNVL